LPTNHIVPVSLVGNECHNYHLLAMHIIIDMQHVIHSASMIVKTCLHSIQECSPAVMNIRTTVTTVNMMSLITQDCHQIRQQ